MDEETKVLIKKQGQQIGELEQQVEALMKFIRTVHPEEFALPDETVVDWFYKKEHHAKENNNGSN